MSKVDGIDIKCRPPKSYTFMEFSDAKLMRLGGACSRAHIFSFLSRCFLLAELGSPLGSVRKMHSGNPYLLWFFIVHNVPTLKEIKLSPRSKEICNLPVCLSLKYNFIFRIHDKYGYFGRDHSNKGESVTTDVLAYNDTLRNGQKQSL